MNMTSIQSALYSSDKVGQLKRENNIMAFVNELIPEEEKAKFTFPVYTERDGSKPTLYKWTIDREREIFLVKTKKEGGGYDGTPVRNSFALVWKGELIRFTGEQSFIGSTDAATILSWRIFRLEIPPALQNRKDEVLQLIREALDAQGLLYNRSRVIALNVEFDFSTSSPY